jgi:DNA-binding NarL/FixJ family response regulator
MIVDAAFSTATCAESADASTALEIAAEFGPDLLLLDMHIPGDIGAARLCGSMREMLPDAKIVLVTAFDRSDDIRDCLIAGADGCLLKDTSETDMAAALRSVTTGGSVLDSRIAIGIARDLAKERPPHGAVLRAGASVQPRAPARAEAPRLSGREQEVLFHLAQGCSNRAIARRLGLSEPTVKGYVSGLLDKLNASSRLEAIVHAQSLGLI